MYNVLFAQPHLDMVLEHNKVAEFVEEKNLCFQRVRTRKELATFWIYVFSQEVEFLGAKKNT